MPKILVRPVSYHWHRPLLNVRKSIKPGQLLCLPKVLLTCKNLWFRDLLNQSCHFYIYQCAIGFSGMSLNSCFLNPYKFLGSATFCREDFYNLNTQLVRASSYLLWPCHQLVSVHCAPLLVWEVTANSCSLVTHDFVNLYHLLLQSSLVQTEDSSVFFVSMVYSSCLHQQFACLCCLLLLYKNGLHPRHCVILNLSIRVQIH